jgi:hypothetical protein
MGMPKANKRTGLATILATGLCLVVFVTAGHCGDDFGGRPTFVLEADLDGDGTDEVIVGVGARGSDQVAEFLEPGDVYVFARDEGATPSGSFREVFACRSAVPEDLLPGFYETSAVAVADVDGDGLPEIVLVWLEEFWWPSVYRPLAVLQFDPAAGWYEMLVDTERSVSEIGGYVVEDVDVDGRAEILEINPVYGTEVNPVDGVEEGECHFCPHRYEVGVFEFNGRGFVADPRFNGGQSFVTPEKFDPGLGGSAISPFLPQLMEYVRSLIDS